MKKAQKQFLEKLIEFIEKESGKLTPMEVVGVIRDLENKIFLSQVRQVLNIKFPTRNFNLFNHLDKEGEK